MTPRKTHQQVQDIFKELIFGSDKDLTAFRLNDPDWSTMIKPATMCASYFVFFPTSRTWSLTLGLQISIELPNKKMHPTTVSRRAKMEHPLTVAGDF